MRRLIIIATLFATPALAGEYGYNPTTPPGGGITITQDAHGNLSTSSNLGGSITITADQYGNIGSSSHYSSSQPESGDGDNR